jgi:hypothetical protein
MFIGHFAIGFASKKAAPKASLGALIAAPIFLDMLWPIFLLLGWEQVRIHPGDTKFTPLEFVSYPISHSMVTAIGWSILFAAIYWTARKYKRGAIVVAIGVFSHWILDVISHRPDMPIAPGMNLKVGLSLWNSVAATCVVEATMFVLGLWIYSAMTQPRDRIGRFGYLAYVVFLAIMYVANIFSPPPPSVHTLAVFSLLLWLFPVWAAWFDAHRSVAL